MKTLIVIDGNSLLFRAFYALPPMNRADGTATGAVYGFFNMLFKLVDEYAPDYMGVAFDLAGGTFRHKEYAEYKAGRRETPEELLSQFPLLKNALGRIGISIIEKQGFEADDYLGTLSLLAEEQGITTHIVTGDRDALQLIGDNTDVIITRKGISETEIFDKAHLKEVYGLEPWQIPDLKGLMGDSSDNIPGVPGVGEKTALKLLASYPSVDAIYENIEELPKNKLREKLIANEDKARMSRRIATIERHAPLEGGLENFEFDGLADEALSVVLAELEFTSLMKRRGLTPAGMKEVTTVKLTDIDAFKRAAAEAAEAPMLAVLADDAGISFAWEEDRCFRAEFAESFFDDALSADKAFAALADVLSDALIPKTVHDAKGMKHFFEKYGIELSGVAHDTMLAAYVLDPTRRNYEFTAMAEKERVSADAAGLNALAAAQKKRMASEGLERIYYTIEMPLVDVLYGMEHEGCRVDIDALKTLQARYAQKITELTGEIYDMAGHEFNIASTKQLGEVLFSELGLPVIKKTKSGFSTDAEVLERLEEEHAIIPLVMEYRTLTKLKSTYLDGLLAAAKNGKVYTTFNQAATATGRLSSAEPNLQNIPVRSELSREIRGVFLPSREGNMIMSADYSQIELRVLAHISGDERMLEAFRNGEDIHARTAAEVFGVPLNEVTDYMRGSAKAVNFGIVYGISDFGLAKSLGIPRYMAKEYIEKYLSEFAGVRRYMKEIVEQAKEEGCVRTMLGRVRYIDELKSSNFNTRSFGERAALNTPIQGTAADIIKKAMIDVDRGLKARGMRTKLILQVHDELLLDVYPDEADEARELLVDCMEGAAKLDCPLTVSVKWGENWEQAK